MPKAQAIPCPCRARRHNWLKIMAKVDRPACIHQSRPANQRARQKGLRSGIRALPRLGLQIPFPPQGRQQVGTFHAQRAATLALRDDRRIPPCLGAQHPAGREPALFDHLPYDGPSLSIGFDLSVRDHLVSQVNQALTTLSDNVACVEAKPRAHRGRSVA